MAPYLKGHGGSTVLSPGTKPQKQYVWLPPSTAHFCETFPGGFFGFVRQAQPGGEESQTSGGKDLAWHVRFGLDISWDPICFFFFFCHTPLTRKKMPYGFLRLFPTGRRTKKHMGFIRVIYANDQTKHGHTGKYGEIRQFDRRKKESHTGCQVR